MGRPAKDITGVRIGALVALRNTGSIKTNQGLKPLWEIQCDCGKKVYKHSSDFLKKGCYSCGCQLKTRISVSNTKHGMSHHPLYAVWDTMIARCHRESHKSYAHYSARGILVCEQWRASFQNFANDMAESYKAGLQLDRIDNDKGYAKNNCRWATPKQQGNNKVTNKWIDTPDGQMTVAQAATQYNINQTTLLYRIANKWPSNLLFIRPSHSHRLKELI